MRERGRDRKGKRRNVGKRKEFGRNKNNFKSISPFYVHCLSIIPFLSFLPFLPFPSSLSFLFSSSLTINWVSSFYGTIDRSLHSLFILSLPSILSDSSLSLSYISFPWESAFQLHCVKEETTSIKRHYVQLNQLKWCWEVSFPNFQLRKEGNKKGWNQKDWREKNFRMK